MHNFYQIRSDQGIYSGFTCYQYLFIITMWKQLKKATGNKIIAFHCIPKLFWALEMAAQCKKKIHSTATWAAKMLKRRHIVFCAGSASHSPSYTLAPPGCLCPVGATPPSKWLDDKADLYFQIVQGLSEHTPCTEWNATTVTEDHQRHKSGHRHKIAVSIAHDLCVKYQIVVAIHFDKKKSAFFKSDMNERYIYLINKHFIIGVVMLYVFILPSCCRHGHEGDRTIKQRKISSCKSLLWRRQ